jgi:DNA-binding NarL/FixJ family response regulator
MDLSMPGMDGVEATERILSAHPGVRVVALTSTSEPRHVMAALNAGAIGYLLKDATPDELRAGVLAAARDESPLSPRAARAVIAARDESGAAGLSRREVEVLALVAEGLPNKLIARRLEISEKTVKSHLTSIFQAIDVTDRTQAALWAPRHGIGSP